MVHSADVQDRDGAYQLLRAAQSEAGSVQHLWADSGYSGRLTGWAKQQFGWTVEIVGRPPGTEGFALEPRRWVIERTFSWLGKYRRLSKDHKEQTDTSESWIYAAMSHILTRRLAGT